MLNILVNNKNKMAQINVLPISVYCLRLEKQSVCELEIGSVIDVGIVSSSI